MAGIESSNLCSSRSQENLSSDGSVPPPVVSVDNNAERTSNTEMTVGYADAGLTSSGDYFLSAAVMKGHQAQGNVDLEVFSVSAQGGRELEVQATAARASLGSESNAVRGQVETLSLNFREGGRGSDGSIGPNIGMGITAAGVALDAQLGDHVSVSLSYSVGVSAELSVGKKDSDNDGKPEFCAKFGGGVLGNATLGVCIESPF